MAKYYLLNDIVINFCKGCKHSGDELEDCDRNCKLAQALLASKNVEIVPCMLCTKAKSKGRFGLLKCEEYECSVGHYDWCCNGEEKEV